MLRSGPFCAGGGITDTVFFGMVVTCMDEFWSDIADDEGVLLTLIMGALLGVPTDQRTELLLGKIELL